MTCHTQGQVVNEEWQRRKNPMHDYQPLDLSQFCNVGTKFIREGAEPLIGVQTWHGLPFMVGSAGPDPARCFIGFGDRAGAGEAVTIPVNAAARYVIFAHTLLESRVREGESIGHVVANYVLCFSDGQEEHVPIRERFEVALVPTWWGGMPFLAVPDDKNGLMPRYEGKWGEMGARQTETYQGWPHNNQGYYLWAWQNRDSLRVIESVRLEPTDRKFIVAAITLGFNDEAPFPRNAKREVKITLPQPEDEAKPFSLEVDVDRGVATFPLLCLKSPRTIFSWMTSKAGVRRRTKSLARHTSRLRPFPRRRSQLNRQARKSAGQTGERLRLREKSKRRACTWRS